MVLPVLAGVLGGIGSALIGARASGQAADAQTSAAQAQIDSNEAIFQQQRRDLSGYRDAGNNALAALNYELGLGEQPQQRDLNLFERLAGADAGVDYQRFQGDGGYDAIYGTGPYEQDGSYDAIYGTGPYESSDRYNFLQNASQRAIDSSAASQGSLFSSATLDRQQENAFGLAAQDFSTWQQGQERRVGYNNQDLANWQQGQERRLAYDNDQYNQHLNRLTGVAGLGQSAGAMTANAAGNLGQANANALANIGDAQAAGAVGFGNALTGGIQNGLSTYGYLSQTSPSQGNSGITIGGENSLWGSGGFWG